MTVDQYVTDCQVAIDTLRLKVWEAHDLRLMIRVVRNRGFVATSDLLILKWSGKVYKDWTSLLPPPTPKKAIQEKLF